VGMLGRYTVYGLCVEDSNYQAFSKPGLFSLTFHAHLPAQMEEFLKPGEVFCLASSTGGLLLLFVWRCLLLTSSFQMVIHLRYLIW